MSSDKFGSSHNNMTVEFNTASVASSHATLAHSKVSEYKSSEKITKEYLSKIDALTFGTMRKQFEYHYSQMESLLATSQSVNDYKDFCLSLLSILSKSLNLQTSLENRIKDLQSNIQSLSEMNSRL